MVNRLSIAMVLCVGACTNQLELFAVKEAIKVTEDLEKEIEKEIDLPEKSSEKTKS